MTNGLDQFLAIRLTTGVVMQVVTDPQKADAILTDHIGDGSSKQKLDDLYGPKPKDNADKTESGDTRTCSIGSAGKARFFWSTGKPAT